MKIHKVLVILLSIILISVTLTITAFSFLKENVYTEVDKIKMQVEISQTGNLGIGIIPNTLLFGRIKPGGAAAQSFTITNTDSDKVFDLYIEGDMAEWTHISETHFEMDAGESKEIRVNCRPHEDVLDDVYESKMIVMSRVI